MRSWMWTVLGAWLVAAGGCNCLIDAGKYRGGPAGDGGGIDGADNTDGSARADGRIESDAGPIDPISAHEGEGAGTGARPLVIVLRGDFAAGSTARVVRSGGGSDLVASPAVVATDGSMMAIPIRIPVYVNLAEGAMTTLEIDVDQGSGEDLTDTFLVDGLDELDLAGTVDTTTLRPLYSRITTSTTVAFAGASPAILRSTTDIDVGAALRASGGAGTTQGAGAAGAGGCRGGGIGQAGQCSTSGGGAGGLEVTTGTGGGGGGHDGPGGGGANGGDGGEPSGNDLLVPLAAEGGNGGGGGGSGTVGAGGPGGGGGGIIEITADGTIALGGNLVANGGLGANGRGALAATAGGSGGGGAGGAILLRAIAVTGNRSLSAVGAEGGTTFNTGGLGADGRIRIDVGTESLPAGVAADPAAVRGPHWADDTLPIVRDADFTAILYGQPSRTFAANVDGSEPVDVETDGSGVGRYSITLAPGHNRICAIVSPTADLSLPEAVRCMIVTYVP